MNDKHSSKAPIKIAVVTNILSPYRIPLFEAMSELVDSLKVFLMVSKEENRHWVLQKSSFQCEILQGFHWRPPGYESSIHFNYRVSRALENYNPDIVVSGGFTFANIQAARYCHQRGKSYIGWGEVSLRDKSSRSIIRKLIRYYITKHSSGTIASSTESKQAYLSYGADANNVLVSLLPIDVNHYHSSIQKLQQTSHINDFKRRFPGKVLLSIGQLIPRKGYQEMLEIYERVILTQPDVSLVILGEGPSREKLENIVSGKGLKNVYFEGFIQLDNVPKYMAISDVFVFHTLFDTFGAVLSEAMSAEMVVVSSVHACATGDLVRDGQNGFVFDPLKITEATEIILNILSLDEMVSKKIGAEAYKSVVQYNYKDTALQMVEFIIKNNRLTVCKN